MTCGARTRKCCSYADSFWQQSMMILAAASHFRLSTMDASSPYNETVNTEQCKITRITAGPLKICLNTDTRI